MRLIELIQTTRWAEVKPHLLEEYPDSDASAYERAYLNLRSLEEPEFSTVTRRALNGFATRWLTTLAKTEGQPVGEAGGDF